MTLPEKASDKADSVLSDLKGSSSSSGGYCPVCTGTCPCPNLRDCGIHIPTPSGSPGFGLAHFAGAESTVVGNVNEQTIPDILTNSATATNTCGLEVTANKLCGDVYKMK